MPEWLVVARRELLIRVRSPWFVIVTLLGPVAMIGLIVVPAYLSVKTHEKGYDIAIVDDSGEQLGEQMVAVAVVLSAMLPGELRMELTDAPREELLRQIRDEELDGYLVLPAGVLDGETITYYGANASNPVLERILRRSLRLLVQQMRADRAELDQEKLAWVIADVPVDLELETGTGTTASGEAAFALSYAVMFILYLGIVLYGVNVMRSVIEEKSSRVVEIVISTIKPTPLMLGKVAGVGGVGLLQLGIWVGGAALIFTFREQVLGLFGINGAGAIELPPFGFTEVAIVLVFFLLGYFFYASLYAAVGAMVNSEQEAQQVQTPVIMLLIIPVACMQLVAADPRGTTAEVLTMIPFASPVLMPMRYLLGGASGLQLALSIGILVAALSCAVWLAARVYRVGILMYGKRPSLRELVRWIRH